MATVHTEYGPGRIIERETVRGRTRCKVAGEGFEVWIDQTKLGGLDDHDHDHSRRTAWAPLDRGNSTTLPYDPDPQHEAVDGPGFDDGSSTIQPIHRIDADERLSPADSITFEDGGEDGGPGPDGDLFARQGGLRKEALPPVWVMQQVLERARQKFPKVEEADEKAKQWIEDTFGLPPGSGEKVKQIGVDASSGATVGHAAEAVDGQATQAVDWASPGGSMGGYGNMIHNSSVEKDAFGQALLPLVGPALRMLAPSAVGGLVGGDGEGGEESDDYGPGPGYGGMIEANHRPAGLSDRYIDITAGADYHNDPVAQFRHDPVAYIDRVGHLMDEGLNPRFAEYMDLVEADGGIRTAAWKDVRKKAMRLKREGHVTVKDLAPNRIMASVVGDHGTYDVVIFKGASYGGLQEGNPGHSISNWHCGCEWGKWAFRRKYTYVGRLCSHAYASYLTMQSAHMTGKPRQRKGPKRAKPPRSLPFLHVKRGGRHLADALQNGPERLTPELVVNDADDAHMFVDVTTDERDDVGPDDVVSERDIVHFARVMAACEANEQPYPRRLVAFLSRYADCTDGGDESKSDWEAQDGSGATGYLDKLRDLADGKQSDDFGSMADRVHAIQRTVEEAREHGADASQFVAMLRTADERSVGDNIADFFERPLNMSFGDGWKTDEEVDLDNWSAADDARGVKGRSNSQHGPRGTLNNPEPGKKGVDTGQVPAAALGQQPNRNPGSTNNQAVIGQPGGGGSNGCNGGGGGSNGSNGGGGGGASPAAPTSGTVADGGVAGAENGNNDAITKNNPNVDANGMYTVQKGDTWTDLAQRTTGDMNNYQRMYDAQGGAAGGNIDSLAEGTQVNLKDFINDVGNNGLAGNVTNPATGGADGDKSTVDAGPAQATTPASTDAVSSAGQTPRVDDPGTGQGVLKSTGSRRRAQAPSSGTGNGGQAEPTGQPPSGSEAAEPATNPATGQPSSAGGAAANPATSTEPAEMGPDREGDTLDPTDPNQVAQNAQARPGQQPATMPATMGTGMGTGMGSSSAMDFGNVMDMVGTGVGAATDIASGIGSALSGLGSIFASKQDFDDFVRYAYPAGGGDDFDPETLPHIPFAGSGNPGPLEFTTSEEYADEQRPGMDDVTDLERHDVEASMDKWQKQSRREGSDDDEGWEGQDRDSYTDDQDRDSYTVDPEWDRKASTDDNSDIVRAFQANLGDTALGAGVGGGGGGGFDDIAGAARGFLRTAGRNYSLAEQSELIREGDKGGARNLDSLDLRNTHYEDMHTLGW